MVNPATSESLIKGIQLQRARELLQLTPNEVAQEISVDPQDVLSWENEESKPNLKQLEDLAKLYGRDIDYFLRETPVPPERLEFRGIKLGQTLKDLAKEALSVIGRFDELCRTTLELEKLLGKTREINLPNYRESDQPEEIAKRVRSEFGLDGRPIPQKPGLRTILSKRGVLIFELAVPENAFSGFSLWHNEYGPCILLNGKDPTQRRNFTLAHELAHLVYRHNSGLCLIPQKIGESWIIDLERKADQFAIEFLLPELGVIDDFRKRELTNQPSQDALAKMAYQKWGASIQALGFRLESLGLIRKGHTNTLFEIKTPFFKKSVTPTWERQLGNRFVSLAFEAHKKGIISSGKLAQTLDLPMRKALEEIHKRTGK